MNQLEKNDPTTWKALKEGNFCIEKSESPFTALFTDQALEQELEGVGCRVGIKQDEVSLDRLSTHCPISPLSSVNGWVDSPASRLTPTLQVRIISSLVTSPYAQQGMH